MGSDIFEISINLIKMIVIFLMMVQLVPILVWVERRGSAFIQNRFGPNRVGPLGLTQLLADAVKFIFKEEFVPEKCNKFLFYAAPAVALIPGALAFASLPLGTPIQVDSFEMLGKAWGPYTFQMQGFDMGIGIVYVLGVSSLGAYALLMAGYGSANKYSLFGALRASAQMISYELALSLSVVGVVLLYSSLSFTEIVAQQTGPLSFEFGGQKYVIPFLPNWGIFFQPLGALLFFVAAFAEANRLPFDLPEAEGELVAGFHTEYSGFKMLMFYIGEYGHMLVASSILVTFYLGGYQIPFVSPEAVYQYFVQSGSSNTAASIYSALIHHVVFLTKVLFFLWVFVWVRWTLPRFRYDQLMDLGWKTMLPWALFNTIATAFLIALAAIKFNLE